MLKKNALALAVTAALSLSYEARAQTQDELRELREQVKQLDKRVTDAEQAAAQAASRPAGENALNPAISLILNGIYGNLSQDPANFRINAHAWDFTDMPLANKVFLGNQLADDGVQLKWVAPTPLYFDIGVEVGRGRSFPAGPEGGRNKNRSEE